VGCFFDPFLDSGSTEDSPATFLRPIRFLFALPVLSEPFVFLFSRRHVGSRPLVKLAFPSKRFFRGFPSRRFSPGPPPVFYLRAAGFPDDVFLRLYHSSHPQWYLGWEVAIFLAVFSHTGSGFLPLLPEFVQQPGPADVRIGAEVRWRRC